MYGSEPTEAAQFDSLLLKALLRLPAAAISNFTASFQRAAQPVQEKPAPGILAGK